MINRPMAIIRLPSRVDAKALHSDLGFRADKKTLLVTIDRCVVSQIEQWAKSRGIGLTVSFINDGRLFFSGGNYEAGAGPTPGEPG